MWVSGSQSWVPNQTNWPSEDNGWAWEHFLSLKKFHLIAEHLPLTSEPLYTREEQFTLTFSTAILCSITNASCSFHSYAWRIMTLKVTFQFTGNFNYHNHHPQRNTILKYYSLELCKTQWDINTNNKPFTDLRHTHCAEVFLQGKVNLLLSAQIILIINTQSMFTHSNQISCDEQGYRAAKLPDFAWVLWPAFLGLMRKYLIKMQTSNPCERNSSLPIAFVISCIYDKHFLTTKCRFSDFSRSRSLVYYDMYI